MTTTNRLTMKTAVIIGGGPGGLFTGALLTKEGYRVTVLDKNSAFGGGLQTFNRFGVKFETGMHVVGGMQPGGNLRRICQYLDIWDEVESQLAPVDDKCTDRLYFAEDKALFELAKGREGFIDSLSSHFPAEREGLGHYVESIYGLTSRIDLFNLRPSSSRLTLFAESGEMLLSADRFIAQYVKDQRLRSVLAYMNPLYGGRGGVTPAYIHAIISTLYIDGSYRFIGGSDRFAEALAEVIRKGGGEVIANADVDWVETEERHVEHVSTRQGGQYKADWYISAVHPCTLLDMMPPTAFPKSYHNRIANIPNAYSAFSLYIKLKPKTFPYMNFSEYYMTRYDEIWNFDRVDRGWPLGFFFMTPPPTQPSVYGDRALLIAPMPYGLASRWERTTVGHRGDEYEAWKKELTERLLHQMEEMHPGFNSCIEAVCASSPLTIRDYYRVKEGSICGFSKDCNNIMMSQLPVGTKVDNLLLTGQNNNLHGLFGVALTAIRTAEAIVGTNHIVNKINLQSTKLDSSLRSE